MASRCMIYSAVSKLDTAGGGDVPRSETVVTTVTIVTPSRPFRDFPMQLLSRTIVLRHAPGLVNPAKA